MASLAGVTDQLQRQNQQELASVIRIANEQLVSSGARQGLDEIAKIFEAQQGTSMEEFKATKRQITQMQKELAKLDGVNSEEKRVLQEVLRTSQASISENVSFKTSIGDLTTNTVEQSIDSVGGMIGGALSGSPLLSFGASFVGDRFQQFKENRKAAKEAQAERADKIAQEAALEEREFALLREQMDNTSVAAASGKSQQEIDALSLDQLKAEKDLIIQKSMAAKQEADLLEEDRKRLESVQEKFGLDQSTNSPPSSPSSGENNNDDSGRSSGEPASDAAAKEQRREMISLLKAIDSRLHGSPDYLKTLNEKMDELIKDDPTSLDIENERELKRHQKKMEKLGARQLTAAGAGGAGGGSSGDDGFGLDDAGGIASILDLVNGDGGRRGRPRGRGGRFSKVASLFKNPKFLATIAAATVGTGVAVNAATNNTPDVDIDAGNGTQPTVDQAAANEIEKQKAVKIEEQRIERARMDARNAADRERRARKKAEADAKNKKLFDAETERMNRTGKTSQMDVQNRGIISNDLRMKADLSAKNAKNALATKVSEAQKFAAVKKPGPVVQSQSPKITPAATTSSKPPVITPSTDITPKTTQPGVLAKAGSAIVNKVPGGAMAADLGKGALNGTKTAMMKGASSIIGETAAKGVSKVILKTIPFLGLGAGGVFAVMSAMKGDYAGAAAETVGMAAPSLIGTPLDLALVGREVYNAAYGDPNGKTTEEKFPFDSDSTKGDGTFTERNKIIQKAIQDEYEKQIGEYNQWADEHNKSGLVQMPKMPSWAETEESAATQQAYADRGISMTPVEARGIERWWHGDKQAMDRADWDKNYGSTHNLDGTVKDLADIPETTPRMESESDKISMNDSGELKAVKNSDKFSKFDGYTVSPPIGWKGPTDENGKVTMQMLEEHGDMGKRSLVRKAKKTLVMRAQSGSPERFAKSPEEEQARQDVLSSMSGGPVTSNDTAVNNKVAAGETLKTNALNQGNKNSNNNQQINNTSNNQVTNTNNTQINKNSGGVRNPDPTATRARIGLGMGLAF